MAGMMAEDMVLLNEMLDETVDELLDCEDEGDIHLIGSIIPFLRRDLQRNANFYEVMHGGAKPPLKWVIGSPR